MKKADGRPAFPIKGYCTDASGALVGEVIIHKGMSLRDYFAIHAPHEAIQTMWPRTVNEQKIKFPRLSFEEIESALRYKYSDAMLAERDTRWRY